MKNKLKANLSPAVEVMWCLVKAHGSTESV